MEKYQYTGQPLYSSQPSVPSYPAPQQQGGYNQYASQPQQTTYPPQQQGGYNPDPIYSPQNTTHAVFSPAYTSPSQQQNYSPQQQGGHNQYPPQQQGGYNQYPPQQQGGPNQYPPQQQGGYNQYPPQQQGGYNQYPPQQQQTTIYPPQQQGGYPISQTSPPNPQPQVITSVSVKQPTEMNYGQTVQTTSLTVQSPPPPPVKTVTTTTTKIVVPNNYVINVSPTIPACIPQVLPVGVTVYEYPTRWQIRQKFFSLGGDLKVKDCYGNHIFTFKGKIITLTNKMDLVDSRNGANLGQFSLQIRVGLPHYKIKILGKYYATMKMRFSLARHKFKIELANGGTIQIKGNWLDYDFKFRKNGNVVAVVSKAFFAVTDTYGLEVLPGEDVVLFLMAVAIIDKTLHEQHH